MDEMSDQKRGIVFVILALIILFVWQHFYKPAVPVTPPKSAQSSQQNPGAPAAGAANTTQTTSEAAAPAVAAGKGGSSKAHGATNANTPENPTATQASSEQTLTVKSPLYTVEFSNRGAVVRSWKLNKYFDDQKTPQPLDLVNDAVAQQLGWPFSLVLSDAKQEATANAGLYEVTTSSRASSASGQPTPVTGAAETVQAPGEIEFHWSDGHLDVKKKITFGDNYELHIALTVTQDGAPQPAALAWRGGFGDKEAYNGAQNLNVFYNAEGKLNLLPVKKVGVSGNQAQPAIQYGPLAFTGIEDQFFTATFIPEATENLSLWHWKQDYKPSADKTDPESQMAAGSTAPGPIEDAGVHRAEGFGNSGEDAAVADGPGKFRMDGDHRQAAVMGAADHSHESAELGLVHHFDDAGDQHRAVPIEDEGLAIDAKNAARRTRDQADSGKVQEVQDERPAQGQDERGSDGRLLAGGHQSTGKLPADAGAAADLVGAVARTERGDRVAACAMAGMDPRPFGDGSVLYFANRDGGADVRNEPDDAADYGGSGAAANDGVHAADDAVLFLPAVERVKFVHVDEQHRGNCAAVLFEQDRAAAFSE